MRRISLMVSLVASIAVGCGEGGSSNAGTEVAFVATHMADALPNGAIPEIAAGARTITNSEGLQITLNKAYLTLSSVTLATDCGEVSFAELGSAVLNFLISPVLAHGEASPTTMAIPSVIDLTEADGTLRMLGVIHPPATQYCGLIVQMLRADIDAQYLPGDIDMANRVVYIEGSYTGSDGATYPLRLDIARTPLPRHLKFASDLTLDSTQLAAEQHLAVRYARWFDGLDPGLLNDPVQQDTLLYNITQSIELMP